MSSQVVECDFRLRGLIESMFGCDKSAIWWQKKRCLGFKFQDCLG